MLDETLYPEPKKPKKKNSKVAIYIYIYMFPGSDSVLDLTLQKKEQPYSRTKIGQVTEKQTSFNDLVEFGSVLYAMYWEW